MKAFGTYILNNALKSSVLTYRMQRTIEVGEIKWNEIYLENLWIKKR